MTSQTSQFQRIGLPCTILFVDVCGSTRSTRRSAMRARRPSLPRPWRYFPRLQAGTWAPSSRHRDEVMCTSRRRAMRRMRRWTCSGRSSMRSRMRYGIKSLAVRVGFHSGPVISHAADVFGDTVNVAAPGWARQARTNLIAKQTLRKLPREVAARPVCRATVSRARRSRWSSTTDLGAREPDARAGRRRIEARAESIRLTATFGT